ncbi:MAG TPA: alpha/beta fold hydrolase [Dehalococcoidia bacterium]|nr:alpha/beta fold hydrolase [Dehalococcoidia bacterium]
MPYAEVNGASLYYQQNGNGPDIVFLHGAGGNHLSWWQQLAFFGERFRCTAFDARGWGLSRGDMSVGRFALGTDLVGLLDHLEIRHTHVIAQSMGGRAVAGLIRQSPERIRSIVLSGTTAGATNDRIRELQDELRAERGGASLRDFSLTDTFEKEQPALATLYRQINALNPRRPAQFLGRPPRNYRGSMHGSIIATGAPVLFVVGEYDKITSPELIREAHQLVGGSRMHQVLDSGHSAYFEKPSEFNHVVSEFFADIETGRS